MEFVVGDYVKGTQIDMIMARSRNTDKYDFYDDTDKLLEILVPNVPVGNAGIFLQHSQRGRWE